MAGGGEQLADNLRRFASRGLWSKLAGLAALAIIVLAAVSLYSTLKSVGLTDVHQAIAGIARAKIAAAALFTASSYIALIGYDLLALRYIREKRVRLRTAGLASFVGHSFTYTLGFGVATGGAIRMRVYSAAGMEPQRIAAVIALCAATFWLGLLALGATALTASPDIASALDGLAPALNQAIGLFVLAGLSAYLFWAGKTPRRIQLAGRSFILPGPRTTLLAILLGVADVTSAALALYMLLPASADLALPAFMATYVIATALGVASHAPGGIGVFEAAMLVALPQVPSGQLLAALMLFRLIYNVCPFVVALLLMASEEVIGRRPAVRQTLSNLSRWFEPLLPRLSASAVFAGGMILLVSGDLPGNEDRLDNLRDMLPLPFIEASHLFGSIVGLVLLVVAYGLGHRLANAWRIAVALLFAGAVFSVTKGIDYEEATGCILVLLLLVFGRRSFYRRAELFSEWPSTTWLMAVVMVVAASTWLGLVVFRDVSWQGYFWWEFGYKDDAPRFLRATLAVTITAIAIGVYAIVNHRASKLGPDGQERMRDVEPIVARCRRTEACLALLGDKRFMVNEARDGFIMYGHQGHSIIAMGDPVADDAETVRNLVWHFREMADHQHLKPVFYQVSIDHLPIYLDADFSLTKLGEEALVDLSRFTVEGGDGRRHRQALARATRNGLTFDIIPAGEINLILDEMRYVSESWLSSKEGRGRQKEKGFSLGFWSEEYVRRFDAAVIRHENKVVAFANIWRGSGQQEASVDLMRFMPDGPAGMMDLMFIELMLHAKREGYQWFNLGMAPFSGLPGHRLAPTWLKVFRFAYRRGDAFFNFEGLRAFKQKYKPVWRPRYLAHPGGLSMPQVLIDCTRLIAASPARAGWNQTFIEESSFLTTDTHR